jgi:hypothetical protein
MAALTEVTGRIIGWCGMFDDEGDIVEADVMVVLTDDGGLVSRWVGFDLARLDQHDPMQFIKTGERVMFYN